MYSIFKTNFGVYSIKFDIEIQYSSIKLRLPFLLVDCVWIKGHFSTEKEKITNTNEKWKILTELNFSFQISIF